MEKRMGRPPKDPKDRKAGRVNVRLTKAQRQMVEQAAEAAGMPLSDFLRASVLAGTDGIFGKTKKRRDTLPPNEGDEQ